MEPTMHKEHGGGGVAIPRNAHAKICIIYIINSLLICIGVVGFAWLRFYSKLDIELCVIVGVFYYIISTAAAVARNRRFCAASYIAPLSLFMVISQSGFEQYINAKGFIYFRSPLNEYKNGCLSELYASGVARELAFCEKLPTLFGLPVDIIYDSGGQISFDREYQSAEWRAAFMALANNATKSELFQLNKLMRVDFISFKARQIGDGFYEVYYNVEH
jgi:hypothetical protein